MKNDIKNRKDIEEIVNQFYNRVRVDPQIGHFFSTVVVVNWEEHLPVMYDFWENVVLFTGTYSGNPMVKHQHIHQQFPFQKADFTRWLALFTQTIDSYFEGVNAECMKQRATSIATVMQLHFNIV